MSSTSIAVFNANIPKHVIDSDTHETIIDHIHCGIHETIIDHIHYDIHETILDHMLYNRRETIFEFIYRMIRFYPDLS